MLEGRPRETLVLHDTPIEIGPALDLGDQYSRTFGKSKRRGHLPPMENRPKQEDILNAILPPREWVENGKQWIQYVSHQPASRIDVARLREMLD